MNETSAKGFYQIFVMNIVNTFTFLEIFAYGI